MSFLNLNLIRICAGKAKRFTKKGKYVPPAEGGAELPAQEDHRQPLAQEEKVLAHLVDFHLDGGFFWEGKIGMRRWEK